MDIGNTVVNPASGFSNQPGVGLNPAGVIQAAANNTNSAEFGRFGGTGPIMVFRYAGNSMGTISTDATNLQYNTNGALIFGTNGSTEQMRITTGGDVGLGTASPEGQLANTSTNIIDSQGVGVTGNTNIAWTSNAAGYVQGLYQTSTVSGANGLIVKIAGTASTNKILSLDTGSSQGAAGTNVLTALGKRSVGIAQRRRAPRFKSTAPSYTMPAARTISCKTRSSRFPDFQTGLSARVGEPSRIHTRLFPMVRKPYIHLVNPNTGGGTTAETVTMTPPITINPLKTYRVSIWIKNETALTSLYAGLNTWNSSGTEVGVINNGGGSVTNPYFECSSAFPTAWYKYTTYIYGDDIGTGWTDPADANGGCDFGATAKFDPTAATMEIRFYNYSYNNGPTTVDFAEPTIQEVNTETPIKQVANYAYIGEILASGQRIRME